MLHKPVMVKEVIEYLSKARIAVDTSPLFIDGCAGHGGHSKCILNTFPNARLICIDRDPSMRRILSTELSTFSNPIHISTDTYANAYSILNSIYPDEKANGILVDLGFNSGQIDDASRGFSCIHDGPLDMRYDPTTGVKASDLVNFLDSSSLTAIFNEYSGESLRSCRYLANAICKRREKALFHSTGDLSSFIDCVLKGKRKSKSPSTTIFQALRIAVNDEFKQLDLLMNAMPDILDKGGVAVFLCFHSLEIKRVKMWMKRFLDPSSEWRQEHSIENHCVFVEHLHSLLVFHSHPILHHAFSRRNPEQSSVKKHNVV